MTKKLKTLLLLFLVSTLVFGQETKEFIGFNVDYKNYLSKHDIVFQSPNYEGFEGLTIGNGDLGGMVWSTNTGIEMQINKIDLYDDPHKNSESRVTLRAAGRLKIDFGVPTNEWLYINDFEGRLSMYDATATFRSRTPFSDAKVSTWVDAHDNAWVIDCDLKTMGEVESGTSMKVELERWGSRSFRGWYGHYSKDVSAGLGQSRAHIKDGDIYLTEHFNGLDFVVACRLVGMDASAKMVNSKQAVLETEMSNAISSKVIVTVVTSNESENLLEDAIVILDKKEKEVNLKAAHDKWWKKFWERSFVNIPDDYIENLYYYRRYVTASASRGTYPIAFNGSLWVWNHDIRHWVSPHHWNTQQQYWGVAVQNDCDLMKPYMNTYFRLMPQAEEYAKERGVEDALLWCEAHDFHGTMVYKYAKAMINNFTPASQIASVFWEYYQFTGDEEFLKEKAYPFMKKAAQFYVGYLQWDETKQEYYSYPSQPYEHAPNSDLKNSNSDLFMIEGLLSWCVEAANILGKDKAKVKEWENILNHLWEPAVIETTKRGKVFGLAYTKDDKPYPEDGKFQPGRFYHFDAHSTQVFPANVVGLDEKGTEEFEILENVSKGHPVTKNAITPGSIVSARLGHGDLALEKISRSIRRLQHFPQGLFFNMDTWYNHSRYADSVTAPDINTQRDYIYDKRNYYKRTGIPTEPFVQAGMEPLSIVSTTLSEMQIQSHEGKIRVFPAVPQGWEGAFSLRARGAFLVSSEMRNDEVAFVGIESLKGNQCNVQNPWTSTKIEIRNIETNKKINYKISAQGVISFNTKMNKQYLVTNGFQNDVKTFSGEKNNVPKFYHEATLGKKQDF